MPFIVSHIVGADVTAVVPAAATAQFSPGMTGIGSDGKTYVYATAGAAISASTAVCTVNASTFAATATGGAYLSPATALSTGDKAWFCKALV